MISIGRNGRLLRVATVGTFSLISAVALAAPPLEHRGNQSGPGGTFDVLADGRLVGMNGTSIMVETAARSGQFTIAGFFDAGLISEFGASFLSLSPDGSRFVVGDGNFGGARVYEVAMSELNGGTVNYRAFGHENFSAAWYDNNRLAIAAADPSTFLGEVRILDLSSGVSTRVLALDGSSAGVAFDQRGDLYTGNGFDVLPGGSATGDVRAFLRGDIAEILDGQRPELEFASDGQFVGRVLSAGSLTFDAVGNLFIGGGDFGSGEIDYFAVADGAAVDRASRGGSPLDWLDLFLDDPDAEPFSFYNARFNAITNEWLVASGSSLTLYRYGAIPAPGAMAITALGVGSLSRRRRRSGGTR